MTGFANLPGYGGPGAVHRFTVGEDDAQMRAKLLYALACRHTGFNEGAVAEG